MRHRLPRWRVVPSIGLLDDYEIAWTIVLIKSRNVCQTSMEIQLWARSVEVCVSEGTCSVLIKFWAIQEGRIKMSKTSCYNGNCNQISVYLIAGQGNAFSREPNPSNHVGYDYTSKPTEFLVLGKPTPSGFSAQ